MDVNGQTFCVDYVPGDSNSGLFGGNSNWRGPIWFPTNFLLIESLQRFYMYYGDDLKVECPTGSGEYMNLAGAAEVVQRRLINLFSRNEQTGVRPINNGNNPKADQDEHWKDHVLFYEFFEADTGRGLGASHQCGWTALIAKIIHDVGISDDGANVPKTPLSTAEQYFDEDFSQGKRHHRRKSTSYRLHRRPSYNPEAHVDDDDSKNMSEDLRKKFERLYSGKYDYDEELETQCNR